MNNRSDEPESAPKKTVDEDKQYSLASKDESFEKAIHQYEIKGIKSKINRLKVKTKSKIQVAGAKRKQLLQQQITLVLLILTLIWFFILVAMWL